MFNAHACIWPRPLKNVPWQIFIARYLRAPHIHGLLVARHEWAPNKSASRTEIGYITRVHSLYTAHEKVAIAIELDLVLFQMWMWRMHDLPPGWQSSPFTLQDQCLSGPGQSLPHRAFKQGSHSHRLSAQLDPSTALVCRARVQKRISGTAKSYYANTFSPSPFLTWHSRPFWVRCRD